MEHRLRVNSHFNKMAAMVRSGGKSGGPHPPTPWHTRLIHQENRPYDPIASPLL